MILTSLDLVSRPKQQASRAKGSLRVDLINSPPQPPKKKIEAYGYKLEKVQDPR